MEHQSRRALIPLLAPRGIECVGRSDLLHTRDKPTTAEAVAVRQVRPRKEAARVESSLLINSRTHTSGRQIRRMWRNHQRKTSRI